MTRWLLVAGDFVLHGGMDRANYALARFLARAGDQVELVTHYADAGLAALPGVVVHRVARPFGSHFVGSWYLSRAGRMRAKSAGAPIVVNGGNCAVPAANWMHYVHAAYSPEPPASLMRRWKGRITRAIDLRAERKAARLAPVVICNSERTRRDVIEHLGV
ncbi:MAG: glycosyltransferase family 4 protein, partial [Hyphomicrobiaceae bacterium]